MTNREKLSLERSAKIKTETQSEEKKRKPQPLTSILQRLGNRTIQRLVVQRRGTDPFQLDDETSAQINQERGNGAPLESKLQMQMSEQMGFDLSGVRVHTSPASDNLNQQLSAKAFTTGQDVFFRSGAYNPESSSGKELIAHELTHVVQQGTGQVSSQGGMTVHAPGDQYEQEADSVAKEIQSAAAPAVQTHEEGEALQMQEIPEEEEELQMQEEEEEELQMQEEEEEELQMQEEEEEELQMQEIPEEEEELQMQEIPEEEEELQMQEEEEEELAQA